MDNKIIAAAREAGFSAENGRIFANCESSPAHVLCTNAASALYALAYRQGLEDAAKCAEAQQDLAEQEKADKRFKAAMKDLEAGKATKQNAVDRGDHWMCVATCNAVLRNAAKAIRSLKEQP